MEIIFTDTLMDYLGVEKTDAEQRDIVEMLKNAALADLKLSAGISAETSSEIDTINEYLTCAVYLSFYANRGVDGKIEYIRTRRSELLQKLKLVGVI